MDYTFYVLQFRGTQEFISKHSVLSTRTTHVGKARGFPTANIARANLPLCAEWFTNHGYDTPALDVVPMSAYPAAERLSIEVVDGRVCVSGSLPYEVNFVDPPAIAPQVQVLQTDRFYEE